MVKRSHISDGERSYDSPSSNRSDDEFGRTGSDEPNREEEEDNDERGFDFRKQEESDRSVQLPKRPKIETLDGISALPDSLLLHILSFLRMKDVVKTGTLSKRWQYLWTSVSTLVFSVYSGFTYRHFVAFVNQTLVMCKCSNIKRLAVEFGYKRRSASDIQLWIRFATQNNVENLDLDLTFRDRNDHYKLPQHLYNSSLLIKLSLSSCIIAPSGVISWNSLKILSIGFVELSGDVIGKILSGSPVLEFWKLYKFSGINVWTLPQ